MKTSLVYNGLRLLDQNSVISLSQQFSQKTSVHFQASKYEIFEYLDTNAGMANVLQTLLRTYGGVFEFETKINPLLLAKKAEVSEDEVISILQKAGSDGILEFRNEQQDMELTFLLPREDDRTINTFAHKIKDLNNIKIRNVQAVLEYAKNSSKCRSVQLLEYFGEEGGEECGSCDVCLQQGSVSRGELKALDQDILSLIRRRSLTSQYLIETLGKEKELVLRELRFLLEEGKIKLTNNNEYTALP